MGMELGGGQRLLAELQYSERNERRCLSQVQKPSPPLYSPDEHPPMKGALMCLLTPHYLIHTS